MAVSNKLCLHCDLCSCPEMDVLANVAYCSRPGESDADGRVVNTIVSSQFLIKIEDTSSSREICNYQARVKITGEDNNPNIPAGEVVVFKPESEDVPAECETDEYKYTFIHDFKFEYEDNILNDQIDFAKSVYVPGCYSNIQIEVHIYAVTPESEDESEFACDDYAIMNRGCDEDVGSSETASIQGDTSEACICSWSSLEHDPDALVEGSPQGPCIIYGEVEGTEEDDVTTCSVCDPCRIAPCFACGNLPISADTVHYLKPWGSLHMSMATNADTQDTYVDRWGIERVRIDEEWNDSPMIVDVKAECYVIENGEEHIILEPEFTFAYSGRFEFSTKLRKSWYNEKFYQNVSWQGLIDYDTYKNTEIYVRYIPQESCECECLYGRKCSSSEDSTTTEYVNENPLNIDLIDIPVNYLNTNFVVGNCKSETTPATQTETSTLSDATQTSDEFSQSYWCRLTSTITNHVKLTYGHNCEYSVTAKWYLQDTEVWSRQFTNNDLVSDLNYEVYDKFISLNSTETLPDLSESHREYLNTNSNIPIEQSYIEICVDEASSSTNDGYTQSAETFTYDECNGCCQKYPIVNKCISDPGTCSPCVVQNSVSCDFQVLSKLAGQEKHTVAWLVDVTGPFLMNAEFQLGGPQSVPFAVADGETYTLSTSFLVDDYDSDSVEICFFPMTSDTPTSSTQTD